MRGDSVRYAEAKGLSREERTQMGRWENGSMDACYGRTLPLNAMRVMAGFSGTLKNYKIHRDIEVPSKLLKQVFPGVENLYEEEQRKPEREQVYAKLQFLELLIYLRKVILQDSCRLRLKYPNHPIFKHPVFDDPDYLGFQQDVIYASQNVDINAITIEEKLPAIMETFNFKLDNLHESFEKFRKHAKKNLRKLYRNVTKMKVNVSFGDDEENITEMEKTLEKWLSGLKVLILVVLVVAIAIL